MTRENKLALVLGFGLMLFVGILVSDHFAARKAPPVATVASARQDVGVPPIPSPGSGDGIVHRGGGQDTPRVLPNPDGIGDVSDDAMARGGESPETVPPAPIDPPPAANAVRVYLVEEGDTFAAIAHREYGRRVLGQALADFNGIVPSRLKAGASIQLPSIATLDPATAPTPGAESASDAALAMRSSFRVYTIREGDTLYRIAQRELGNGGLWKELERSNADVIKDAGDLTPGTQIKIPVSTARADRSSSV